MYMNIKLLELFTNIRITIWGSRGDTLNHFKDDQTRLEGIKKLIIQ